MQMIHFLTQAKKSTYASGTKYKVSSTKPNSIDYHYEKDNYVYHDTYFGSREFYGEEIVYLDNKPIWHMKYKGRLINHELTDVYDKILRPALRKVDEELPIRGPKEFIFEDYKYTFEINGSINKFEGIEKIYRRDKLVYELICYGGKL